MHIDPPGETAVPPGGELVLVITASDCYKISRIYLDNEPMPFLEPVPGTPVPIVLTDINSDRTVEAVFERLGPYTVTVKTNDGGTVEASPGGIIGPGADQLEVQVLCGDSVILQITPSDCYVIKEVKTNAAPLGAAVQVMLKRTPEDIVKLIERDIPVRLCKGAYSEPADIAYQKREEIDRQFLAMMKRLLTAETYNAIATHDGDLIEATKAYVKNNKVMRDSFEFQMLMGFRRPTQRKLIRDGWRLRIYVPFGRRWLPYMIRRLRERKKNTLFLLRNIFRR